MTSNNGNETQSSPPHAIEPWGWTLPFTQYILLSFDTLSQLLAPNDLIRIPGSHLKIAGEIRPRTKSLQQILRSVMFFEGSDDAMIEIRKRLQSLGPALMSFLNSEEISSFLKAQIERDGEDERMMIAKAESGENGRERTRRRAAIFEKKMGSVELKRRKDALSSEKRARVLDLMGVLEGRIEGDLRGVEDVMWPRKIIKFDSSTSVTGTGIEVDEEESPYWIVRASVWICELAEEIWEDGEEIMRGVLRGFWFFIRTWKLHVWVAVLVGGLTLAIAYLNLPLAVLGGNTASETLKE
ncbi:hypothetical protein DL98DRAFT_584978 [Cadophora sp. DSE1049]|nr:hypothetical protein DL98DRAFT_584978 [Cadophora sp. DSE1049]